MSNAIIIEILAPSKGPLLGPYYDMTHLLNGKTFLWLLVEQDVEVEDLGEITISFMTF